MKKQICDLHCDTLYRARKEKISAVDNFGKTMLSLSNLAKYDNYIQVMAVWSDKRFSNDEAYDVFLDTAAYFKGQLAASEYAGLKVAQAVCGDDIKKNESCGNASLVLAVEGANLVDTKLSRLEMLRSLGVRLVTLAWGGRNQLGGSHENSEGLTDLGRELVCHMFELDMIPDLSHSNPKMTDEVLGLAARFNKPVVATHSDAYALCAHSRNLSDEHYKAIVKSGGVVGVSLACMHLADLTNKPAADSGDFIAHLMHYRQLDKNGVGLGSDFDGVDELPRGISEPFDLYKTVSGLDIPDEDKEKLLYNNARDFLVNSLKA